MHVPLVPFLIQSSVAAYFVLAAAHASAAGIIVGQVVDPDGRPVSGARVLLTGAEIPLLSAITNEDGRFSIEAPDAGRFTVRIAVDGFRADALAVDGSPERRDLGTIRMSIAAVSESVVVSAAQVETPLSQAGSSVTVISGTELTARQLHTVADALRIVPGLSVVSTGGVGSTTAIFPRGGESNFTLALIDGVPANAFGGDFDFGQVSTSNIERIEIVRGPQSALFGSNAIGAVVRIITRKGGPPAASLDAETGSHETSRLSASTSGQHRGFEWGASFDRLGSDGLNGTSTSTGAIVSHDDYVRRTGAASAGWRGGSAWIRADVRHSHDERGFPGPFGSNPIGTYEGIDTISRGENARTLAAVGGSLPLTSRLRAQGQLGYNRIESDFASPFGDSESYSRRWIGRTQVDVALRPGLDVSTGVEAQRERAGSTFITGASFQQIPVRRRTIGYFGEMRWNWSDRVFTTSGVRIEDIRREGLEATIGRPVLPADTVVSVNPRFSVAWLARGSAAAYTKLRGAIGTGIRPPDGFELAFTDNPELRPERSRSAELGVDQAFAAGRGLVEATLFMNDYDDLIVAVGSFAPSSRYRSDNISNARTRGLELAVTLRGRVHARHPIDLSVRIGYTRLATEILAVDESDAAPPPFSVGQALLRRPAHQFFTELSASIARASGFLRGGGRGAALDVEPSLGTFGGLFDANGYQVWHAGASWRVTRFADFYVRVENLFDRSYEEAFGFPAPGRRASGGLRIAAGR